MEDNDSVDCNCWLFIDGLTITYEGNDDWKDAILGVTHARSCK